MKKHNRLTIGFISLQLCLSLCVQCNNSKSNSDTAKTNAPPATSDSSIPPLKITYHYDTIRSKAALDSFRQQYTPEQQKIIAASNRIDLWRINLKSALIIPDTMLVDFTAYSPFPQKLPGADSIYQLILINQRIQLFAAYENGKLVQFGPISTGRKAKQTPNKLYYTNYKSKRKVSTVDGDWIMPWYFNISNYGGIGMHEYTLPGYPASHSCIRMYKENAFWIFNWAQPWQLSANGITVLKHGTPVLVFGIYDFDQPSPWKLLPQNPEVLQLTTEEWATINDAITTITSE